ncbi:hypothetical protein Scep_018217 [Stephania cephalantha]|uniref:SBP-type domain-containing protein n=1 Tax=Stephania cephalantha TaxID=152367 RepID=A0AAP0IR37_9MAGN
MLNRATRAKEEEQERLQAKERDKGFMDWELKTPAWDFAEFDREANPNIVSVVGSSSTGDQKGKGDCSVDLKLGRFGDFGGEMSVNKWSDPRDSTAAVATAMVPSPKRPRAPNNGMQTVSCSVDGCTADLSKCRDYHRRHKVCEVHSKTPRVMVGGQEQRFCQQCSRFHLLVEFDEVKRSCRKRLDGHNRRRRKPQPDSIPISSGSLFTNHQGARLMPFANPQVLPTTSVVSATWPTVVKTEEDSMLYNNHPSMRFSDRQNPFPGSLSRSYKGEKQFPFLHVSDPTLGHRTAPEPSVCQPLLNTIASSESGGAATKMFSEGLARIDSDCALSLLSSPPTQTSGISSMSHMVQHNSISMAQPLIPTLQYNDNSISRYHSQGMEGESVGSVLVSHSNDADIHCSGIFHVGHEGSSQEGVPQTLPFSWE